jgi:hypothetical protein
MSRLQNFWKNLPLFWLYQVNFKNGVRYFQILCIIWTLIDILQWKQWEFFTQKIDFESHILALFDNQFLTQFSKLKKKSYEYVPYFHE